MEKEHMDETPIGVRLVDVPTFGTFVIPEADHVLGIKQGQGVTNDLWVYCVHCASAAQITVNNPVIGGRLLDLMNPSDAEIFAKPCPKLLRVTK